VNILTTLRKPEKNSKQWFADLYRIDVRTFIAWLRRNPQLSDLANDNRKLYTPAEAKRIIDILGEP